MYLLVFFFHIFSSEQNHRINIYIYIFDLRINAHTIFFGGNLSPYHPLQTVDGYIYISVAYTGFLSGGSDHLTQFLKFVL